MKNNTRYKFHMRSEVSTGFEILDCGFWVVMPCSLLTTCSTTWHHKLEDSNPKRQPRHDIFPVIYWKLLRIVQSRNLLSCLALPVLGRRYCSSAKSKQPKHAVWFWAQLFTGLNII
jgi:hypothetical protein